MSKAMDKKRTGQMGEYLVAAQLCNLGWHAVTFSGNMPIFDIIAVNDEDEEIKIQVKTVRTGDWQPTLTNYVNIELNEMKKCQYIIGPKKFDKNIFMVFVRLKKNELDIRKVEFFICNLNEAADLFCIIYGGIGHTVFRPKKWKSTHIAIKTKHIEQYRNNWDVVINDRAG